MPITTPASPGYDLISLIHQQEDNAFTILYRQYWPSLLQFAGHFIDDKDTCQEVVQELFIQLHIKRPRLKTSLSLTPYLYSSLRNKILNHLRDRSVYNRHLRSAQAATNALLNRHYNREQFIDMVELKAEIAGCLSRMPAKYREVYVLHEHYHFTLKEVAAVLGRPADTVEKQQRKAIHLLRDHLFRAEISPVKER